MMKRIILHGNLAEKHPEVISVEAETVAEALQALTQFPELTPPPGSPWNVRVRGVETEADLYSVTPMQEIHVIPEMGGAGGGRGLMQILIGITLIAVAIINPAFLSAASWLSRSTVFMTGVMMVTGGILQMMLPVPETNNGETRSSRIGSSGGNTTRIGTPIPLAYGTQPLFGHYLSFDVDALEWSDEDADELPEGLIGADIQALPGQSTTVGVYPLPDATNTAGGVQGYYAEYDKTDVPYTLVAPVFSSPITGPGNVPVSSWIV